MDVKIITDNVVTRVIEGVSSKMNSREASSKEYVIWGIPEGGGGDTLLLSRVEGDPITSKDDAKKYQKVLEQKHGARKTRIQEIDLEGEFDWMKETGLKASESRESAVDTEGMVEISRGGKVEGALTADQFRKGLGLSNRVFLQDAVDKFNKMKGKDAHAEVVFKTRSKGKSVNLFGSESREAAGDLRILPYLKDAYDGIVDDIIKQLRKVSGVEKVDTQIRVRPRGVTYAITVKGYSRGDLEAESFVYLDFRGDGGTVQVRSSRPDWKGDDTLFEDMKDLVPMSKIMDRVETVFS